MTYRMCGIGGILNFKKTEAVSLSHSLQRMSRQMHFRGPDDEGYYLGQPFDQSFCGDESVPELRSRQENISNTNSSAEIGLVHRRLAIIDLSLESHQPMLSANNRYVITFNGEIYNYRDLSEFLKKRGVRLRTTGDTEVLLELYALLGASALDLMNGDFAFAIWDKKERSLFCARDRIGIKPFYYVHGNNNFLFASDIKTLIAAGVYSPALDVEGLMLSFAFGMAPRPRTAFDSIRALEPGKWMKIHSSGVIEEKRYWSIPVGTQDCSITEVDALDLIEGELVKAVRLRTHADVPVGVFMSGGIDSTLVSAVSASQGASVEAYTLGFDKKNCIEDEVEEASVIARHIGIKHNVSKIDPRDYLEEIERISLGYEEPFYSVSPNFMVSKFVAGKGVKVALNGLGGDELFAGYDYYKWCSAWEGLKSFRSLARLGQLMPSVRLKRVCGYLSCESATSLHSLLFLKIPVDDLHSLFDQPLGMYCDPVERVNEIYAKQISCSSAVEALSYMDLKNYVGNHHVERTDQFTMMNSIEGRFPFLDHNLIEAAYTIPAHLKLKNNERKYLLRKLSRKFLPQEALDMPKKGFSFPLQSWMKNELSEYVRVNLEELGQVGVFEPAMISRWYREYEKNKRPYTQIWQLVSTNVWFKHFILSPRFGE